MINLVLAVLIIIATILLIGVIGMLGLWMKGVSNILFPGLGLIVSTPLVLIFLIIVEVAVVTFAAYLVRFISIG